MYTLTVNIQMLLKITLKEMATVQISLEEDKIAFKKKVTVDYVGFSYYQSTTVSSKKVKPDELTDLQEAIVENPTLERSDWGWKLIPEGLRIS